MGALSSPRFCQIKPSQGPAHKECSNRFYIWDLPSCFPPFCRNPTTTLPCQAHLVPLPPNLTPRAHGHGTMLANIIWITETEEQNWNSIRKTCSRKFLSNKHGKLDKKHLGLRQRLPLYTGEETPTTLVLLSASDPGQLAMGAGKANTQKMLLP